MTFFYKASFVSLVSLFQMNNQHPVMCTGVRSGLSVDNHSCIFFPIAYHSNPTHHLPSLSNETDILLVKNT